VGSQRAKPKARVSPAGRAASARGSDPLTVSRAVIVETARGAALEVPGVLGVRRGGPLARLGGSPIRVAVQDGRVSIRVWIVARPGHPLGPLAAQVRHVVAVAMDRLLGLEVGDVSVVVDGVGSPGS
jgi:uncharacterized alkaline shock family protein YloU